ncbi:MAG: outer membrane protein transport protein [Candidatus Edwardsbacteria bacterium]|nr:outer membrane protein transport protein [Candidatus Edwardsbacteria bacterium]MBU1576430.1 outer membrane protein transport protein [Candidatus Edwardsbacteria bacterium]MBU2463040.1 outer membrane protein transport protein [Candidatus Edwardsbacteria bacterium]MBU2593836.1 outer membrane protein transport protein [Candidatus Edwardsbacteria bacterium]
MRKLGLLLLALAAIGSLAYAQNIDFNIMGAGARAHGMGGAFIGVSDDATAVGWNPAGIAQLDKMEASINGFFNIKKYSYEETWIGGSYDESNSISHFAPSFASFILPLKAADKNLVLAVAYQRLIDFGFADSDTGSYFDGTNTITWEREEKQTGGIDAITPAIAFQVTPQFSVGAAGNILVKGSTYTSERTYSDGDFYNVEENYSYSGFNINAGALATMNKFNIGVSMRLPFTLTESAERQRTSNYLTPATYDTTYPDFEVTMPLMFGAGIALKPTDKFTISADFEHRSYSNSEATKKIAVYDTLTWVATGTKDTTYNMGWHNVNQFRFGLEYILSGATAVFPVRLGFRTDPKLFTGHYGDGTDTTQAVGKVFTGGFGLVMGKVMLDLAYEYGVTNWVDIEIPANTYTEKYIEKTHNILASCIFHF